MCRSKHLLSATGMCHRCCDVLVCGAIGTVAHIMLSRCYLMVALVLDCCSRFSSTFSSTSAPVSVSLCTICYRSCARKCRGCAVHIRCYRVTNVASLKSDVRFLPSCFRSSAKAYKCRMKITSTQISKIENYSILSLLLTMLGHEL